MTLHWRAKTVVGAAFAGGVIILALAAAGLVRQPALDGNDWATWAVLLVLVTGSWIWPMMIDPASWGAGCAGLVSAGLTASITVFFVLSSA